LRGFDRRGGRRRVWGVNLFGYTLTFVLGTACLAYLRYCLKKGRASLGIHGWVTREESPKLFWFNMILFGVFGVGILLNSIIMYLRSG
jgi:hypothetical protein